MSGRGAPPPPRTTLGLILSGLPPEEHPLTREVSRIEDALDRLDRALRRQQAAATPAKDEA